MRVAAVGLFLLLPLPFSFGQDQATGSERETVAGRLGLVVKDGVAGTAEAHAIAELQYWISWEDFDLAEVAYRNGCRDLVSPSVRFLRSWALLRWTVSKKKGFDRVLAAFEEIDSSDAALREHVAALAKSIRAVMPCVRCDGKGRIRCVACHGAGEIRSPDDEAGTVCGRCEQGHLKCPSCEGSRPAPCLEDICASAPCRACDGRGLRTQAIRLPCADCRGLGVKLTPKVNPEKKLP